MEETHTGPIRVVLADDHPLLRTGFSMTLGGTPDIEVVASCETPEEAISLYEAERPDVLVMDILFHGKMTGLDATREVLKVHPDANVVMLTQHDQDTMVTTAYEIGAKSFVTKNADPHLLVEAIRRAAQGKLFFLPRIAERLAILKTVEKSPFEVLNEREQEVWKLIAEGKSHAEIADLLGVSLKTVTNTAHTLRQKLGVGGTADLTRLALRHGLIGWEQL